MNKEIGADILNIINNSPIAFILVNKYFNIIYSNNIALSLFGYDELKGLSINTLVPMHLRKTHNKKMVAYQNEPQFREMGRERELKGVKQDGTEIEVEIGLNPITIGSENCILASIIDITERRIMEKFKDHFLMMMTHELRTPLNAVTGYSEMIKEDMTEKNQFEYVEDLDKINKSAEHLLDIVDNLMESSRIYSKQMKLNLETFDIHELVNTLKIVIEPSISSNIKLGIKIDKSLSTQYGDYLKIKQSLLCILSNAVKFTNRGTITLRVSPIVEQGKKFIRYIISDTGIGISQEQQNKIFEKFYQVDVTPTRRYGGTGLGLFICRRFSDLMGGSISLESTLGKGSNFTLMLPEKIKENSQTI